jgi:hypothetical protein
MHPERPALPVFVACAAALCGPCHAVSVLQSRGDAVPGCRPGEVIGSDAELEARAARIGDIEFAIGEVFDADDGDRALFRAANQLHPATREATLRANLLFGTGQPFARRVLDETERSLRGLRYLYDAQIEPVRYHAAENVVDVRVCTRDVWTLSPGISFGRGGGTNSYDLELEDSNVFGSGQSLALSRLENVDRSTTLVAWSAPNLVGTRWRVDSLYATSSDGGRRALALTHPFFSLATRRAFGVAAEDADLATRLYAAGEPTFEFATAHRDANLWFGRSGGLDDGWVRRVRFGLRFEEYRFSRLPDSDIGAAGTLPHDRRLAYPWVSVEWLEDGFAKTHDLDQIGRTEDMNLGFSASFLAGAATQALGSDRDALVFEGAAAWSTSPRPEHLLTLQGTFASRLEDEGWRNAEATLAAHSYWRWSARWMSVASFETRLTRELDADRQVLLGGDNGLRGYPLRFTDGTSSALFTLEHRLFTAWEPLRICRVGGALFFDAGRTWGAAVGTQTGWLKDIGVGLRLGNRRSSRGNVIHVDFAVPLDAQDQVDSLQVVVRTQAGF